MMAVISTAELMRSASREALQLREELERGIAGKLQAGLSLAGCHPRLDRGSPFKAENLGFVIRGFSLF